MEFAIQHVLPPRAEHGVARAANRLEPVPIQLDYYAVLLVMLCMSFATTDYEGFKQAEIPTVPGASARLIFTQIAF